MERFQLALHFLASLSFPFKHPNLHSQAFFILLPDSVACRMKCEEKRKMYECRGKRERIRCNRCKKDVRWGQMGREDEYKGLKVFQVHNTFNAPFPCYVCECVSGRWGLLSSFLSFFQLFFCVQRKTWLLASQSLALDSMYISSAKSSTHHHPLFHSISLLSSKKETLSVT